MDTTAFLTEREDIQRRMEMRRLDVTAYRQSHPTSKLIPWALSTGMSLVSGMGMGAARRSSYGWLGSLAGAVVLPAVLKMLGHKPTKQESFWQKILHTVLPR